MLLYKRPCRSDTGSVAPTGLRPVVAALCKPRLFATPQQWHAAGILTRLNGSLVAPALLAYVEASYHDEVARPKKMSIRCTEDQQGGIIPQLWKTMLLDRRPPTRGLLI